LKNVLIETSARHVHVSQEDLEILFGKGYELTVKKMLSQPGQFACDERVTVVGPKGEIKNISILGPVRPATQVEISLTDARSMGVIAPVRESGDIEGTPGCTLIGPKGSVTIEKGIIAAKRHMHTTPEDAEKLDVKDKEIIFIKIETPWRSTIYGDVVVRVHSNFATAMHIDTDESNAAGIVAETYGEIIKNI
jgi:Propanediol utilization protein